MTRPPVWVALDTPEPERALALARAVGPHVRGVKLGLEYFLANGPAGVRAFAELGLPVFLDLKLHDIPNTVAQALRALDGLGVAMVNVHAGGGAAMLGAARDACPAGAALIAVTVLTSLDDRDLEGMGVGDGADAQAARLAELSRAAGLDGVVCSAREVAALRARWPGGRFVVPGIRPAGAATGDQKRVMTPAQALAAGATDLVIGRPITGAGDPGDAARTIGDGL